MSPGGSVANWSREDKIKETLIRSKQHLAPEVGRQIDALISPENIAILLATLVIWGGAHFVGVGEIVDVALLLFGALMLGPSIVKVASNLLEFGKCINAKSEEDLDRAAKAFAEAVVLGGITIVMAILLRKGAKAAEARAGAPRPSWVKVATPKGKPGLPDVGKDPYAGQLWSKITATGDPALKAGTGEMINWFGDIVYSLRGSVSQQQLVRLHETLHAMLTPRFALLRSLRVQIRAAGYIRSVLLKYLEEAMVETYAQLRVNGFIGFLAGIRFPIKGQYVSVAELATEGRAIGTIIVGTQQFTVSLIGPPQTWPESELPPGFPAPTESSPIESDPNVKDQEFPLDFNDPKRRSLSAASLIVYGEYELWPLIWWHNPDISNPNVLTGRRSVRYRELSTYSAAQITKARAAKDDWKKF